MGKGVMDCDREIVSEELQGNRISTIGGEDGPDHLLVDPPGKRPRDPSTTCMASFFPLVFAGAVASVLVLVLRSLCILYILSWTIAELGRLSVRPDTFRVQVSFRYILATAILRAVP